MSSDFNTQQANEPVARGANVISTILKMKKAADAAIRNGQVDKLKEAGFNFIVS